MDLSGIGEEEDRVMRGSDKEVFHKVFLPHIDPHLSLSSPMLTPVEADGISLDIPCVGDRHHHVLFGDEIFDLDLWSRLNNFRFSLVSISFSDGKEFLLDQVEDQSFTGQDRLQTIDQFNRLLIFFHNFTLLKIG